MKCLRVTLIIRGINDNVTNFVNSFYIKLAHPYITRSNSLIHFETYYVSVRYPRRMCIPIAILSSLQRGKLT
jgi:hypothetical protein